MRNEITRDQLYELVWSKPMREIAGLLGVSDVALGKTCRRAGIPVPGLGYWAKVQAGKSPPKLQLPPRTPGMSNHVDMPQKAQLANIASLLRDEIESQPFEELDLLAQRMRAEIKKVAVPKTLKNPHPQIARLLREDEPRQTQYGNTMFASTLGAVFADRFERRRLVILNALFLALARLGYAANARGREARELSVRIGHVWLGFTLDKSTNSRGRPAVDKKTLPRLRLELSTQYKVDVQSVWDDSDTVSIEDMLPDIVVGFIVAAEAIHRAHLKWREEYELRLKEEERQRQIEAERRRQRECVRTLLREAKAWRIANDIRAYVHAVTESNASAAAPMTEPEVQQWSGWALREADRVDPTNRAEARMARMRALAEGEPV